MGKEMLTFGGEMLATNEKYLNDTAVKLKLSSTLKTIFFHWPALRTSTLKMIDFMGDVKLGNDAQPLFARCLLEAVRSYEQTDTSRLGDTEQMRRYLRGLLMHAADLNDYHIVVNRGSRQSVWDPFECSLRQWLDDSNAKAPDDVVRARYSSAADNSIRLMVMARIIGFRDVEWIEEARCEKNSTNSLCGFFASETSV